MTVLFALVAMLAAAASVVFVLDGERFAGSHAVVASAGGPELRPREANESAARPETVVPPGLSLTGPNAFRVRLKSGKPRGALVVDLKSGRALYKRHPLERYSIASLTKIMTALIVVDKTRRGDKARVTRAALRLLRLGRRRAAAGQEGAGRRAARRASAAVGQRRGDRAG